MQRANTKFETQKTRNRILSLYVYNKT
jgi:hypothetical protein